MKIIITGGGTGGHYYPASLIAKRLIKEQHEVFYFGNENYLEKKECDKNDISFFHVSSKNTSKKNISFFVENLKGVKSALSLIRKIKPHVVYSTGGFTTAPVVLAAMMLKVPIVLHEQNAVVGLVQRLFRRKATSFIHSFPYDVRKNENLIGNLSRYQDELLLKKEKIVFLGGSGGAKFINELAITIAELIPTEQFLLISGKNHDGLKGTDNLTIHKYVEDMLEVYSVADLIIARAGSTTLAELSSLGLPSIIIPMPNSADNHQVKNAEFYSSKEAIIQINQNEKTKEELLLLLKMITEDDKNKLIGNIKELYSQESENRIIKEIELACSYKR